MGIARELWAGDPMLELRNDPARQPAIARAVEKKRNIVKMSLIVVIVFAISWLPYHVYFLLVFFVPEITTLPWIEDVYLGIYLVAMSTTLVNPLVYYCINQKFRQYFHKVFFCKMFNYEVPELTVKSTGNAVYIFSSNNSSGSGTRARIQRGLQESEDL